MRTETIDGHARPDRPGISMPCDIRIGDTPHVARITDIGYGGFGLSVASDVEALQPGAVFHATITGLGEVGAVCRWRRGDRIGAQFTDEDAVQDRIEALLTARGLSAD